MDQKIRTNGALATSFLLAFCAIISLILGIGMAASYPDEIWWAGLLLTLCGILVGYGSISSYRSSKKERKISDEQMSIIKRRARTSEQGESKFEVLTTWAYSISEWKAFMKWEQKERSSGTLMEAAILVGLGTLAIHFLKGEDWITAFTISIVVGLIYGIVKYIITMSSIKLDEKKLPEVIITNQSVIVNGHMNRFYGNNLWLGKVDIKETKAFNILEITYCWYTRRGETFDEIRIPIPKGSLKEAIYLQGKLIDTKKLMEQPY
jgi:hypothetical protein